MPFGVLSRVPDIITHAKFCVNRLRGFSSATPRKVPFPILFWTTFTTVLHYRADCDHAPEPIDMLFGVLSDVSDITIYAKFCVSRLGLIISRRLHPEKCHFRPLQQFCTTVQTVTDILSRTVSELSRREVITSAFRLIFNFAFNPQDLYTREYNYWDNNNSKFWFDVEFLIILKLKNSSDDNTNNCN